MNILWFTWKDLSNPEAGGAEVVNEETAKRLVAKGHNVTFLVAGFKEAPKEEVKNGYRIVRVGNKYTVYILAALYYLKHLKNWPDIVIEEINTIPFLTQLYCRRPRFLYIYQLCREIWFHQMIFPINIIGYLLEPAYLWILKNNYVITESMSTKIDLTHYGFRLNKIHIVPIGISLKPVSNIKGIIKRKNPSLLSFGAMRSMKRTLDQVKAFELAKKQVPHLEMYIAGDSSSAYGKKVIDYIQNSIYSKSIHFLGKVDVKKKISLMQSCHLITVTSIKEGWGLIVTEAASQGTPSIVYNVDGLRDAVDQGRTGLITQSKTPESLSHAIVQLLTDKKKYFKLQKEAYMYSKQFSFDIAADKVNNLLSPYGRPTKKS